MNLNAIHLEFIKGPSVYNSIIITILMLVLMGICILYTIGMFNRREATSGVFFLIIVITLLICAIKIIPESFEKYKAGDIYKVYIDNKENAKEITKEEYYFIKNVKEKTVLGDKPTESEFKKIKFIILK